MRITTLISMTPLNFRPKKTPACQYKANQERTLSKNPKIARIPFWSISTTGQRSCVGRRKSSLRPKRLSIMWLAIFTWLKSLLTSLRCFHHFGRQASWRRSISKWSTIKPTIPKFCRKGVSSSISALCPGFNCFKVRIKLNHLIIQKEIFKQITNYLLPDSFFMIIWDILHILIIFEYIIIVSIFPPSNFFFP